MKIFIVVLIDREGHYLGIAGVYSTEEAAKQVSNSLWRIRIESKEIEDVYISPEQKRLEALAKAKEWKIAHNAGN